MTRGGDRYGRDTSGSPSNRDTFSRIDQQSMMGMSTLDKKEDKMSMLQLLAHNNKPSLCTEVEV